MSSPEFYADTPRIIGTELEHGNIVRMPIPDIPNVVADTVLPYRHIVNNLPEDLLRAGQYLGSGDRIYMDLGDHLEWSTAEFDSAARVVGREHTSHQLIIGALHKAKVEGDISEFEMHKIVTDGNKFWGYHENYLTPRGIDPVLLVGALATHLATRQVYAGAGDYTPNGATFMSQKMRAIKTEWYGSAFTDSSRPLVDILRDEPHADGELWRRLHITSGDPHMMARPAWLQLVTTSIVFRLIEQNVDMRDLLFAQPVAVAQAVNEDLGMSQRYALPRGNYTAIEIQEQILDRAMRLNDSSPLPAEEQLGLELWGYVLDLLKRQDPAAEAWVEHIAKRNFIEAFKERKGGDIKPLVVSSIAREWTNLDPQKGFGLRRFPPQLEPVDFIAGFGDTAPPDTRAAQRGALVDNLVRHARRHEETTFFSGVDWSEFIGGVESTGVRVAVKMPDPFGEGQKEPVAEAIEYLAA